MSNEIDEQLIENIQNKDQLAYRKLYEKYKTPIYNYLDRLVFDKDVLDDIFQNVFIKLYYKAGKFKKGNNFKNWLYRIATNEYIDYYRKLKRKKEKLEYNDELLSKNQNFNIEEIIYNKELLNCFHEALEKLESPYKETFVMRRIEGLTIKDTAEILKVSERSVKNYSKDAENFIKSYLLSNKFLH